ncbi:hypothetical protein EJ05DRAFT_481586 [Pseudovirgaria hyperparasitica]|uniref:Uncharacterized protein n=1 Tax=Pseudovirgaria hyperparasitica TaxID=470096 RepID=A0A6A6WKI1_9PEZI|nr:uncharacterized protein EJ05DRAFT_481586 [Pseudovirgaria hyperparasitica]KAF2762678.1 hypothetical protein EJ05DRAFT_481586 [Pseudovirgaria hyperparasitica]
MQINVLNPQYAIGLSRSNVARDERPRWKRACSAGGVGPRERTGAAGQLRGRADACIFGCDGRNALSATWLQKASTFTAYYQHQKIPLPCLTAMSYQSASKQQAASNNNNNDDKDQRYRQGQSDNMDARGSRFDVLKPSRDGMDGFRGYGWTVNSGLVDTDARGAWCMGVVHPVMMMMMMCPHKWFSSPDSQRSAPKPERTVEHWDSPVPGTYEYVPGRGWSLIAIDQPAATLIKPISVKYSRVLKRHLLIDDYNDRKRVAPIKDSKGRTKEVGFFRLDDGTAWVNFTDSNGDFIPGPYKLWIPDARTGKFRDMLKGDSPEWRGRQASRAPSLAPSHCSACSPGPEHKGRNAPMSPYATTPAASRPNSIDAKDFFSHVSAARIGSNASSSQSSSRNLSVSATLTTAPTTPSDSLHDAMELSSKLEAIGQHAREA